jgi:hypothetical protein
MSERCSPTCSAQHDAHDLGEPTMLRTSGILEASFTAPWGDLHTAERQADDALALGPRDGRTNAAAVHGAHLVVVRWHLGSLADLLPLVRAAAARRPDITTIPASCALAEAVTSDRKRAPPVPQMQISDCQSADPIGQAHAGREMTGSSRARRRASERTSVRRAWNGWPRFDQAGRTDATI